MYLQLLLEKTHISTHLCYYSFFHRIYSLSYSYYYLLLNTLQLALTACKMIHLGVIIHTYWALQENNYSSWFSQFQQPYMFTLRRTSAKYKKSKRWVVLYVYTEAFIEMCYFLSLSVISM